MSNTNNGGPAFPAFEHHAGYGQMMAVGGMTLRDYFAASALQGFCANSRLIDSDDLTGLIAKDSYLLADAMLKAREAE